MPLTTPGTYKYQLVDVFSDRPFCGNPLAVFTNAVGLDPDAMQRIARELNLSETTFVFPSKQDACDYAVRIFTPTAELEMASHPTIGTAFALRHLEQLSKRDRVVFEEGVGPVSVTMVAPMTTMKQPLPIFGDRLSDWGAAAAVLGLERADLSANLPIQAVCCGLPFTLVPVRNAQALGRVQFRNDIWRRTIGATAAPQVMAFTLDATAPLDARARVFSPAFGVAEDPATGSAGGALGAYLMRYEMLERSELVHLTVGQGFELGRPSQVQVMLELAGSELIAIRVGGQCVWTGCGEIHIGPQAALGMF